MTWSPRSDTGRRIGEIGLFALAAALFLVFSHWLMMGVTRLLDASVPAVAARHQWFAYLGTVLLVSAFALGFVLPLSSLRRDWRTHGLTQAFIVALYAEMYGFPLTAYLVASSLGLPGLPGVTGPLDGHLLAHLAERSWGWPPAVAFWTFEALSTAGLVLGFDLIVSGWRSIHRAGGRLVTGGVYARLRHPQYAGILVATLSLLVHWPTLATLAMWPVLAISYVRLARREERRLLVRHGQAYLAYQERVPAFVPGPGGLPAR